MCRNARLATAMALLLSVLTAPGVHALPDDRLKNIEIVAQRAVRDERAGFTVYSGNVVLEQGSLRIAADRLTFFHDAKEADRIIAEGTPARMSQKPAVDKNTVNANAQRIVYVRSREQVVLTGAASIEQGGATVTGESIEYFLAEERVRADASDEAGDRVQVVIPPDVINTERDDEADGSSAARDADRVDGAGSSNADSDRAGDTPDGGS